MGSNPGSNRTGNPMVDGDSARLHVQGAPVETVRTTGGNPVVAGGNRSLAGFSTEPERTEAKGFRGLTAWPRVADRVAKPELLPNRVATLRSPHMARLHCAWVQLLWLRMNRDVPEEWRERILAKAIRVLMVESHG